MIRNMSPGAQVVDEEEEYESSQDSDFNPETDNAANRASGQNSTDSDSDSDSDSSDDRDSTARNKRKRPSEVDQTEDAGFENSGDEAIISKAQTKKKKKHKSSTQDDDGVQLGEDDDEDGEGGFVKTRRMRAQDNEEKKAAAATGPVTIDVDALWAQMVAGTAPNASTETSKTPTPAESTATPPGRQQDGDKLDLDSTRPPSNPLENNDPPSMIRIKRTYKFAGKVHTEEKLVPRDSAEARLYLASQKEDGADTPQDDAAPPQRALKKAFRSAFEPVLEQTAAGQTRSDLNLGVGVRMKAREDAVRAKKLNTVEKSRMDWAGYVDREGLKDELERAGKSKGSYAERQEFLLRSEARREEGVWKTKVAGKL